MGRDDILLYMGIANFLLTWGVALYMYLSNKNKATNQRIGELEKAIAIDIKDHEQRVTTLEAVAKTAPTHDDLSKVYVRINGISDQLKELIGENRQQTDTLRLIQNRIIEKGMP